MRWLSWSAGSLGRLRGGRGLGPDRASTALAGRHDRDAQARGSMSLASMYNALGRLEDSLRLSQAGLEVCRSIGDDRLTAQSLNGTGWVLAQLGRLDEAERQCEDALARLQKVGDEWWMAATLDSLANIALRLGRPDQAVEQVPAGAELYERRGDLLTRALVRKRLGDALAGAGRQDEAVAEWYRALDILSSLGHPLADRGSGEAGRP